VCSPPKCYQPCPAPCPAPCQPCPQYWDPCLDDGLNQV
jgi:hypothetical protein